MNKLIIALFAVLVLLTACSGQEIIIGESHSISEMDVEGIQVVEVRMDKATFEPNTIEVEEGTTLRLVFMNEEPYTFTMEGYSVTETVNTGNYIQFVADRTGTFQYSCVDCDESITGLLRVS